MAEVLVRIRLRRLPESKYLATSPDLPGLVTQGRTIAETMEIASDVARKLMDSHLEHGDPLPRSLRRRKATKMEVAIPIGVA